MLGPRPSGFWNVVSESLFDLYPDYFIACTAFMQRVLPRDAFMQICMKDFESVGSFYTSNIELKSIVVIVERETASICIRMCDCGRQPFVPVSRTQHSEYTSVHTLHHRQRNLRATDISKSSLGPAPSQHRHLFTTDKASCSGMKNVAWSPMKLDSSTIPTSSSEFRITKLLDEKVPPSCHTVLPSSMSDQSSVIQCNPTPPNPSSPSIAAAPGHSASAAAANLAYAFVNTPAQTNHLSGRRQKTPQKTVSSTSTNNDSSVTCHAQHWGTGCSIGCHELDDMVGPFTIACTQPMPMHTPVLL